MENNYYKYSRSDITEQVIKNCRVIKQCNDGVNRLDKENQRENFRELLGFNKNEVFESKEYPITKKIKKIFKNQKIIDQYRVEKCFIDLFFPVHKLGIEIDKNCHLDRPQIKEQEREETIKNAGITLIRINPDEKDFDVNDEIQSFIYKSGLRIGEDLKKNKIIEDLERSVKIVKLSG